MGSSGMKRRGRQQLPKVGTPGQRAQAQHRRVGGVARRSGLPGWRWVSGVAIVVAVAVVALLLFGAFLWL